jgi:6-pyruvoyl-tetrahydropterin synthase
MTDLKKAKQEILEEFDKYVDEDIWNNRDKQLIKKAIRSSAIISFSFQKAHDLARQEETEAISRVLIREGISVPMKIKGRSSRKRKKS